MPRPLKPRDPETRRENIERAALELFSSQGFSATSTAEIAKRAGVAEGTIFRHFPSKKSLLTRILRPFFDKVIAPAVTASVQDVLEARYDTLEDFLRALISERLAFVKKLPRQVRLVVQEAPLHKEVREMVAAAFGERVVPAFRAQLQDLQARGLVDESLPVGSVIRMIVSVVAGYLMIAHVFMPHLEHDDDAEIEAIVQTLSRGLAPPRA